MLRKAFSVLLVTSLASPALASSLNTSVAAAKALDTGTLYAFRPVAAPMMIGYEHGRFFDGGLKRPPVALDAVTIKPAAAMRRTATMAAKAKGEPFMVQVPNVPPPAYERTFRRLLVGRERANGYDHIIAKWAASFGLDPRLVKSVIAAESEFTAKALSPAGAMGLMQVMPATAGTVGVARSALLNPESNILAGTAYLAYLFGRAWKKYHLKGVPYSKAPEWLIQRVIAAYNGGPRFLNHRKLFTETREYVRKVLMFYRSRVSDIPAPKP